MKKIAAITLFLLLLQGVTTNVGLSQSALVVRIDTLFTTGHHLEWSDYTFSEYNEKWHWTRSRPYPSVLYEDDLYTVSKDNYGDILFTSKQPSLYIDTHNGWLQYEYVNRQYYFTGKFHQILRHGDYYYFINPKRVDSLRIDQNPGNPLVKNTIIDIWDENFMLCNNKSKWCDPESGYGGRSYFRGFVCHGGCCIGSHRPYTMPTDTLFHGAFVSDGQLLYVISCNNEVFIAQKNGNDLARVKELGQGWNFYDYGEPNRWWNLGTDGNRLMLPFSTAEASTGMLIIDGNDIRVRYVMSPATVVP